jgi:hypothetical protein
MSQQSSLTNTLRANHPEFMAADFMDAPGVAQDAFGSERSKHLRVPVLNGPIEARDTKAVDKKISNFKTALGDTPPDNAFIPAAQCSKIVRSDGGAARWAVVASLLTTAKLNNVEPFAYLKDVRERMSNGHPMSRLDELLPWNWASSLTASA